MLGVVGGDGDGHGEAVGIAGLGEEGLGLGGVLLVGLRQLGQEILGVGGIHAGAGGHAGAAADEVDDLGHIDGVVHGLADPDVVKGLDSVVQVQCLDQLHGVLLDGEAVLHLALHGVGQMDDHIQRAALQAHDQRVGVGDDLEGDLVQIGGGTPVVVELLRHQRLLGRVGDELEGAGADGVLGDGGAGALGDDGGGHGEDELQTGLLQSDGDGGAVLRGGHGLHIGEGGHERRALVLGAGAALQRVDHVSGRDGLAVVELHALPQGEGVGQAVLGDLIAAGDSGDYLAVGADLHQALKEIEHDLAGAGRAGQMGIEAVQILCDTDCD